MAKVSHETKKRPTTRRQNNDLQLLRDNLQRSYAERIRRHQLALITMEKLQKARFL